MAARTTTTDTKAMDAWLSMLSDEERAGVMKTQIAETEATNRAAIEEEGKSRRALIQNDGYHIVRTIFAFAALAFVGGLTCVGTKAMDIYEAKVRGGFPAAWASAPAPSASVSKP